MFKIDKELLVKNSELIIPLEYVLNAEEESIIKEYNINLKYKDNNGRLFQVKNEKLLPVHALKAASFSPDFSEEDFKDFPQVKPHTAFNAKDSIFKGDIQIRFRGEIDDCLAFILYLQKTSTSEQAKIWLNAMHAIIRNVLSASCRHTVLQNFEIAELSADTIHAYSHNPLKYIGYDHIIPSVELSEECLKINMLRTKIRLMEVTAYNIYIDEDENVLRPDILYTLNRLSSAAYVLLHFVYREEQSLL